MIAQILYKKWTKLVDKMNSRGVPLPTVRDPKTGVGSISLTLVFVSSIFVILGIVGKWSRIMGDIDMGNAMEFFYTSCALYFGRQWQMKSGTRIEGRLEEGQPPLKSDQNQ